MALEELAQRFSEVIAKVMNRNLEGSPKFEIKSEGKINISYLNARIELNLKLRTFYFACPTDLYYAPMEAHFDEKLIKQIIESYEKNKKD